MSVVDGSAWDGFCDALKQAGQAILRPECPATDADRAEGYHYLLGLVQSLVTVALHDPGPEHPAFVRGMDDVVKYGLDAPDGHNSYAASVRPDLEYRIWGIARPAIYVGWQVMGPRGTLHNCALDEFAIAPDGTFEIIVSRERREGNWIPLAEGANLIMQRQFHYDWAGEDYIETHIATLAPRPGLGNGLDNPTPARMDAMFDALGKKIGFHANFWVDFVHGFRAGGDNVAPPPIFNPAIGGSTSQLASNGYFDVPKGKALLIEFRPPKARYWSVVLGNFWFMSIELHHHQSSLNGHQAHVDDDGICRVVLAHDDPGIANWLDPFEHTNGTITFRWLLADAAPDIAMRLLPADEIDAQLPASTRRISSVEREVMLAGRRAEAIKRWRMPMSGRWFTPLPIPRQPPSVRPVQ